MKFVGYKEIRLGCVVEEEDRIVTEDTNHILDLPSG